jgi:hypothetical protein
MQVKSNFCLKSCDIFFCNGLLRKNVRQDDNEDTDNLDCNFTIRVACVTVGIVTYNIVSYSSL